MKTDDFIGVLARQSVAVDSHAARNRLLAALVAGALASALLMTATIGPRSDFATLAALPAFWVKIAFVAGLFAASLFAFGRLSRPGAGLAPVPAVVAAPLVALWLIALTALLQADPGERSALVLGQTWQSCALLIAMLSAPVFIAVAWAMRELAPTRLRLAGACAGLLAGSTGALVYCLHCPEIAAPFLGVWYVLGMLVPTAFGALVGERLLRW